MVWPDFAKKIRDTKDSVLTEEATKNAFIMPVHSTGLGYDVFDPTEVVPEFTADAAPETHPGHWATFPAGE